MMPHMNTDVLSGMLLAFALVLFGFIAGCLYWSFRELPDPLPPVPTAPAPLPGGPITPLDWDVRELTP